MDWTVSWYVIVRRKTVIMSTDVDIQQKVCFMYIWIYQSKHMLIYMYYLTRILNIHTLKMSHFKGGTGFFRLIYFEIEIIIHVPNKCVCDIFWLNIEKRTKPHLISFHHIILIILKQTILGVFIQYTSTFLSRLYLSYYFHFPLLEHPPAYCNLYLKLILFSLYFVIIFNEGVGPTS